MRIIQHSLALINGLISQLHRREEDGLSEIQAWEDTIDSFILSVTCIQSMSATYFPLLLYFPLQKGGNSHWAAFTVLHGGGAAFTDPWEVSAQHRLDVKDLALICAEVQTVCRFNKADFYLLVWSFQCHRGTTLCHKEKLTTNPPQSGFRLHSGKIM